MSIDHIIGGGIVFVAFFAAVCVFLFGGSVADDRTFARCQDYGKYQVEKGVWIKCEVMK